jgi:surface protein
MSSVTSVTQMFMDAEAFNADIAGWDVGSVTNMRFMFGWARAFDTAVSGWTSKSSDNSTMEGMFK